MIFPYLNFLISKSFPYPSEKPQPKAFTIDFISALANTLSIVAFSTFKIFALPNISIGADYLLLSEFVSLFIEHPVSAYVNFVT